MDSYSALVTQILQVPILKNRIDEWPSESLNLVSTDWLQKLKRSPLHEDFRKNAKDMFGPINTSNHFRVQHVKNSSPIPVIVAGKCKVYTPYKSAYSEKQPFAVTMQDCPPLDMLGKAWTSDVHSHQLSDSTKLNFRSCSMCCRLCAKSSKEMTDKGLKMKFDFNQPCIMDLEVYNGETLDHCFSPQLKNYFSGDFIGVIHVELNVRYFYTSNGEDKKMCVRIGGKALSMMAFPESNLVACPQLSLGNLPMLEMEQPPVKRQRSDSVDEENVIDIRPKKRIVRPLNDSFDEECEVVEETITFD